MEEPLEILNEPTTCKHNLSWKKESLSLMNENLGIFETKSCFSCQKIMSLSC